MSVLPRVGLLAGHGVDVTAWQQRVTLPATCRWQVMQPDNSVSLLDLDALVWLWNPTLPPEPLQAERTSVRGWLQAALRTRKNQLIPFLLVATAPIPTSSSDPASPEPDWTTGTIQALKGIYRQELQSWVPASLVDSKRMAMQVDTQAGGVELSERVSTLRTTIHLWQRRQHRQAERCLAVGLILTALYVVLLLITVPWTTATAKPPRLAAPLSWSRSDWQYHLTDCQQLLQTSQGKPFEQLTVPEQERFTEHLRWLPISADLLEQRRPTKEVMRLRSQVQQLLNQMEGQVERWTNVSPTSPLEQAALQATRQQILNGVFEPRRPPTVLHQAAERYWLSERTLTLRSIQDILTQSQTVQIKLTELLILLRNRLTLVEASRVHAPELKAAWLQELTSCIAWIEKAQASGASESLLQQDSAPLLLRAPK